MLTNKQKKLADYIRNTRDIAPAEVAQEYPEIYRPWVQGETLSIGDRRTSGGVLYEVHNTPGDNLHAPQDAASIWKRAYTDEWPEWVQPTGAHDAYGLGDKVTHKGKKWVSDIKNNVWTPGDYGWTEA